ncbi:hypothetical protein [Ralstonia phage RSP15]|uniref:tail sheath stabilizer n=1 Tax=Ralstonia phage RSP15 TaxID=1785960 RepID=UPI00074D3EB6|nr:tail sheath stabilizer [Ralstonia phage RSP15]BAU39998.1 hypothetical protein [Ralstonia phage RSP15]
MSFFGKENHYYNGSIRRYTILFGSIFNDLYIRRTNGEIDDYIHVPLKYGKGFAYEKVDQEVNTYEDNRLRMILPAMGFTLDTLEYDSTRKLNKFNKINTVGVDSLHATSVAGPLPYNLNYTLSIRTKNMDDMLQIIEQIMPVFNQRLTIKMNEFPSNDINRDVVISLTGQEIIDNSDEQYETSRYIETNLNFEVKGMIWAKSTQSPLLSEIEVRMSVGDIHDDDNIDRIFRIGGDVTQNPDDGILNNIRTENKIVHFDLPITAGAEKVDKVTKSRRKTKRDSK